MNRATSRIAADDLTLDAVMSADLRAVDVRITAEALSHQAQVAESDGNPQLAENLRRAAELTAFEDAEVLAIYDALRPNRSSSAELEQLADRLASHGAPLCARLVSEALDAYRRRGLLREP